MGCCKIEFTVDHKYHQNLFKIFNILGMNSVITTDQDINNNKYLIYCRETDVDDIIETIANFINSYKSTYQTDFFYDIRKEEITNDDKAIDKLEPTRSLAQYKDFVIYLDSFSFDDIFDKNSYDWESLRYIENAKNKTHKIPFPLDGNEFVKTYWTYMESITGTIFILSNIKIIDGDNVLIFGQNGEVYQEILKGINPKINIDIIKDINIIKGCISKEIYPQYDFVLIDLDAFKCPYIRDIVQWVVKPRNIIISGVKDLYDSYYLSLLNDYKFDFVRTNTWSSIVMGDYNKDNYLLTPGNAF